MLSLRAIFRLMLLVWFILVLAMGIGLNRWIGGDFSGNLLVRLFFDFSELATTRILTPEPPHTPPQPAEAPSPWRIMKNGEHPGQGRIGKPEIAALSDGALEVRLPYQGTLGEETHFHPKEKGVGKLDALAVDLHGVWKIFHDLDARPMNGHVCRIQIYAHPDRLRVSAIACEQMANPSLAARIFFSSEHIRIVFSKGTIKSTHG
ncbi:MAG: hypothetical protein LBU43_11950 [Candidatus Accumulibacter sp.]|jgi:hypothetical protein|nr:hypothetical protein [Accumulibacter sp.]